MTMIDFETFEASFRDFQGIKRTLPAKIIHLRRISQGNHVRRMKIAQQRKELQASFDASSLLSAFNPRKDSINFLTPFTTPGIMQNVHSESCKTIERSECSTGISNNGSISTNREYKIRGKGYYSKFTVLGETENVSDSNKGNVESDQFVGDSGDEKLHGKNLSNEKGRQSSNTNSGNELCSPSSNHEKHSNLSGSREKLSALHVMKSKQRNDLTITSDRTLASTSYVKSRQSAFDKEKTVRDGTTESKDNLHPLDLLDESKSLGIPSSKNQNSGTLSQKRTSMASKIPIALSRLVIKDDKSSSMLSDCTPKSGKNSEGDAPAFSNHGKCLKELPRKITPILEDSSLVERNNRIPESSTCDTKAIPENCEKHRSFDNKKDLDMSSVTRWLSDIVNRYSVKKSSESFLDKSRILSSNENDSHERETFSDSRQLSGDFVAVKEQDRVSSDTEQSEEYYDTEETEGEPLGYHLDVAEEEWSETLDDGASTIIIPDDKDLELETHREETFRELPDYPSTPYNLRYPRCIRKYDDSVLRSDGKEMDEVLRQLKPSRIRKKTYSLTPKVKKNGKTKKNFKGKSQMSRKKDLFQ